MKRRSDYIALLFLSVLLACVEPYDFDPQSYEKVLVIDGAVSNQEGPYTVTLNYTYPLETNQSESITTAKVWVEDGDGNTFPYTFTKQNTYSSPDGFRAETGKKYALWVEMPDGSRYRSDSQLLQAAPLIDTIYGKYAELPNENEDQNVGGIQFFIDANNSDSNAKYFRYEWEEAYKIITPYPAQFRVADDSSIVPLDTAIGICYQEGASNLLIYGTSVGNAGNQILEFPVRFLSESQQQLRTRYSILVRQHAIGEAAYLFYKRLRENNESGGSLFDQQVGSVYGNMYAVDNPDEAVLGFFEVAGVSEKRSFFDYADLADEINRPPFIYDCFLISGVITTPDSAAYYLNITGGNIYSYLETSPDSGMPSEVGIQSKTCTDCSFYAEITPPDYWIE
ncbi:MAG: DUF4249 domain-containing protein [Cyclobacteriaceae bacterium]